MKMGYRLKPLQEAALHLPAAADPRDMLILTTDNQLLAGVDAYLHVLAELPHTTALVKLLQRPLINRFARRVYRWIANHRSRISQVCRLKPDEDFAHR
jgi:predicted DCC family thiol-disulfide oxidoreductase YuxK